jgi:hypothetical protein
MQGVSTGGPFSCDVPIQTSSFRVLVSGRAAGSRIKLSLRLPNATITNAEMNCGSDFLADAQSFNALDPSLRAVGGRMLNIPKKHPPVLNLSHETTNTFDDTSASPPTMDQDTDDDAWTITIRKK